jgi:hypothetical protein
MIISGVDDFDPKRNPCGRRARAARAWFGVHGPRDLQPLPLGYNEREDLKCGGHTHILAWYACSLACLDYAVLKHPQFEDYARGIMASEYAPGFITHNEELQKRFPPIPLAGLGPALLWEAQAVHARTMANWERSMALRRAS